MRMTFGGSLTLASFNIHQRSRSTGERELTENITNKFQPLQSLSSLISLFTPHTDTKQRQALTPFCLSTGMRFWVVGSCQSDGLIRKLLKIWRVKGNLLCLFMYLFRGWNLLVFDNIPSCFLSTCFHFLPILPGSFPEMFLNDKKPNLRSSQVGVVNSSLRPFCIIYRTGASPLGALGRICSSAPRLMSRGGLGGCNIPAHQKSFYQKSSFNIRPSCLELEVSRGMVEELEQKWFCYV